MQDGRLDVLVNCAGISGLDKSIIDMTYETWQQAIDTNLTAVFLATQAAARLMVTKGIRGAIINIGSINSFQAQRHAMHYVATKGAIPLLTQAMAVDLSEHGIRVNAIAPGMISTERTGPRLAAIAYRDMVTRVVPLGRTGSVDEVAALATFLASDECNYLQGETILIDGGLMAHLRLE
jgi:NAD(P)-dependent dehydrogenase (short-subunit alcohol dehydrogenase family)